MEYENVNINYENDVKLAKDELIYDKDINDDMKPLLKDIVDKFIENYNNIINISNCIYLRTGDSYSSHLLQCFARKYCIIIIFTGHL